MLTLCQEFAGAKYYLLCIQVQIVFLHVLFFIILKDFPENTNRVEPVR